MKSGFLDKLIERLGRVGPEEVQNYLLRLAQEKGLIETVFNSIQEGIIVTDAKGRITYLNGAACELFGLETETSIGKRLDERVRGVDWDSLVRSTGAVSRDMEIFYPANRFINFYIVPLLIEPREKGKRSTISSAEPAGHAMILARHHGKPPLRRKDDRVGAFQCPHPSRRRGGTRDREPAQLSPHPPATNGAKRAETGRPGAR